LRIELGAIAIARFTGCETCNRCYVCAVSSMPDNSNDRRLAGVLFEGVFELDLANDSVQWHDDKPTIFGFDRSRAIDRTWWRALVHPDDLPHAWVAIRQAVDRGDNGWQVEYRFRRADESWAWVLSRGYIVRDARGRAVRAIGALIDVTHSKETEALLRKKTRLFSEAESLGRTGSWEHDLVSGEILQTEEQRRLFFGDDPTKGARFEDYADVVHPDDRARVMSLHDSLLASGAPNDIEYRVIWPDGSVHTIFGRAQVVRDDAGKPIRTFGTNVDVTERRRIEAELQRRVEQQHALAELGLRALRTVDRQELFEEAVRMVVKHCDADVAIVAEPSRVDAGVLVVTAAIKNAQSVSTLVRAMHDGASDLEPRAFLSEQGVIDGASVTIPGRSGALGVLGAHGKSKRSYSADDVAFLESMANVLGTTMERWRAENDLRQAQKMEAVGRLAGGIAHDFNNLLSVILSNAELMKMDRSTDGAADEELDQILEATGRAATLTRQLLTYQRQDVVDAEILAVHDAVSANERLLRSLAGERVELTLVPSASKGHVRVPRAQLEQVLVNLVVNARDAMPSGGRVRIDIDDVDLDVDQARAIDHLRAGPHVVLTVRDDGTGMDRATRARIFEPFFTTKARTGGTGLGLATVLGIVRKSAGTVTVESGVGQGTSFRIYLPCVPAAAVRSSQAQAASMAATEPPRSRATILVMEDDDQVRAVTRNVLQRAGHRVLEAPNAGEALLVCEKHEGEIDLLVADVTLPQTSGLEIAPRLRALRPEMKVLFVSGFASEAELAEMQRSATPFLQKPFSPHALLTTVDAALRPRPAPGA
jgi:PAS domain S-box-containing protein